MSIMGTSSDAAWDRMRVNSWESKKSTSGLEELEVRTKFKDELIAIFSNQKKHRS